LRGRAQFFEKSS